MNDGDLIFDVEDVARRVAALSRAVPMDEHRKQCLRQELVQRHQDLAAVYSQRAAAKFWPRLTGFKRLTLVAPPALAVLTACSMLLWGLPFGTHQTAQAAEAARITQALVRTVPTVTGWKITARQRSQTASGVFRWQVQLNRYERLYVRTDPARSPHTYLYSSGKWFEVAPGQSVVPTQSDWQFAFAVLPSRLHNGTFSIFPSSNRSREGIRYTLAVGNGLRIDATAWIDRETGLVMRLDRQVLRGRIVVESDSAEYRYQRRK